MKRLFIFPLACLLFAHGCSKEDLQTLEQEKYYTVTLNLGGEISSSDEPLTKAGESDLLYGIWIGKDGSTFEQWYGGGLFDNVENVKVNLLAGHTYYFRCTMVANGKNVVTHYVDQYCAPFSSSLSGTGHVSILQNKFGYRGIDSDDRTNGYELMSRNNNYLGITKPSKITADRYYGEAFDITPSENASINIELRHTVVGVKYKILGLTDGSIALTVKRGNDTFISESAISTNEESEGAVFECSDILSAYQYPNSYKETATVSVIWNRGIGISQNLGSVDVDLLRNRMNIIRINLGADDGDASLGIKVDQTSMSNEGVTIDVQ